MQTKLIAAIGVAVCVGAGGCKKSHPAAPPQTVDNPEVDTFVPAPVSPEVPADWPAAQSARGEAKAAYIAEHQVAFDWFANVPFSERDGIPYIALRLLPEIAPEIWGSKDNFLDVVGLFMDERLPGYPVARGIGFSGLSRDLSKSQLDYASFTCGACHIGRVQRPDGGIVYLDGAMNSEFNIAAFRVKAMKTMEKVYQGKTGKVERAALAVAAFAAAAELVHVRDKNFFYKNYRYNDRVFDAAYEKEQVKLFLEKSAEVVPLFAARTELEYEAYTALLAKNYQGFEGPMTAGLGGMVDATGVNTGNLYIVAKLEKYLHLKSADPVLSLPPTAGLTDIMTVWEQGKRKAKWNKDQTRLMHGGGQWNGNIPIPMYRNLAAQLTLGLLFTDIRVSAFGVELLDGLPATVYPFHVDVALAKKGRALFQDNCADCHRPHNGTVYEDMGTDMGRAGVVDESSAAGARDLFGFLCSPTTSVDLGEGPVQPCAEFDGVSLVGKKSLIMSPVGEHLGYNALPLGGIWAQAPYLHTGAVPTLYHLLVVNERPASFVKSRLTYDQERVGYQWALPNDGARSYVLDTQAFHSVSNRGHDKDITRDGRVFKLDWSDDIEGAKALVEYMKTL